MLNAPSVQTQPVTPLRVLRRFIAEHGEEHEEVACPLCGHTSSTLALLARDLLFNKPGTYRLVRCDSCTLSYVNPRPTLEALGAHYPDDYHCYRGPEDAPRWMQPFARREARDQAVTRLRSIERVIGRLAPELKVLDVGCGRNELLRLIKATRGSDGLGIEMKPEIAAYVRDELKMPLVEGTLLGAKLESARFDLTVMLEYLEHEPDPLQTLAEARRVLKPGGHLVLEIPDPEGPPARLFKDRWVNLDLPRHLVFFDRRTLREALAKTGFELVSHQRYSIPLYTGYSVLLGLGVSHIMRAWEAASIAAYTLGVPLLPVLPWLQEFSFVVARARD